MEKSFFFDAVVTDGTPDITYGSADLAAERGAYFTDGVLAAEGLTLSPLGGFVISLSPGAAVIDGHTYVNTSVMPYPMSSASAAYDRIDLAVIRLDTAARRMSFAVVPGMPDAHPTAPEPAWTDTVKELPVAQVYLSAGVSGITAEDITDVRAFSHFAPDVNAKKAIVEEYLASLNTLTDEEAEGLARLLNSITFEGDAADVLCADGEYRTPNALCRVELMRYDKAGNYSFSPFAYPSEDELYDIVLVGGGGAGGCVGGEYCRGGGGGAGAYMSVHRVRLPIGTHQITVGAGGVGVPEADGGDGGVTSCAGFYVGGGYGGKGGHGTDVSVRGGDGGESAGYRARSGGAGAIDVRNESIMTYGAGAYSFFGAGALNMNAEIDSPGVAATNPGSGGSGAGCTPGSGLCRGGNGADGCVIIYGYRRGLFDGDGE